MHRLVLTAAIVTGLALGATVCAGESDGGKAAVQVAHPDASSASDERAEMEAILGIDGVREVEEWDQAAARARHEHTLGLVARGDRDSLLAAVYLSPRFASGDVPAITDDQRARWFAQVRDMAPNEPLVAWLEATGCEPMLKALRCDRPEALQRLARIDPDNAAVWVELMAAAQHEGDREREAELLARAASSARYDTYDVAFGRMLLAGNEGFASTLPPLPHGVQAALEASDAVGVGEQLPELSLILAKGSYSYGSLQAMFNACRGEDGAVIASRRADCMTLAQLAYEDSTSLLVRGVATGLMVLLTKGQAEHEHWLQRRHAQRWQQEQFAVLVTPMPPPWYTRRSMEDGELPALMQLLAENDIPEQPPADWRSAYPHEDS
jgi:hypothetical protein